MYSESMTNTLPPSLVDAAPDLWMLDGGLHNTYVIPPKLFRELDDATQWVYRHLARNIPFKVDVKTSDLAEDDSVSPLGTITALQWRCPSRRMKEVECLAACGTFGRQWVESGDHPNTPDLSDHLRQSIGFRNGDLTIVTITRVSRYIGYLARSSILNDKSRDIAELVDAWYALGVESLAATHHCDECGSPTTEEPMQTRDGLVEGLRWCKACKERHCDT